MYRGAVVLPGHAFTDRRLHPSRGEEEVVSHDRAAVDQVVVQIARRRQRVASLDDGSGDRDFGRHRWRRGDLVQRAVEAERPHRVAVERGHSTAIATHRYGDVLRVTD